MKLTENQIIRFLDNILMKLGMENLREIALKSINKLIDFAQNFNRPLFGIQTRIHKFKKNCILIFQT